jgi:cupin fold WbuC family metalloprotein
MKIISTPLLNDLLTKAGSLPRKRSNYNIHESGQDAIQLYIIAARIDSYFRPHRHVSKFELAIILQGRFDLLIFDDNAVLTDRISLGPDSENKGFELPPNVWHTWIPTADDSIFIEIKEGPYDPATGVDFASWSPPEGDRGVVVFLQKMRNIAVGSCAK